MINIDWRTGSFFVINARSPTTAFEHVWNLALQNTKMDDKEKSQGASAYLFVYLFSIQPPLESCWPPLCWASGESTCVPSVCREVQTPCHTWNEFLVGSCLVLKDWRSHDKLKFANSIWRVWTLKKQLTNIRIWGHFSSLSFRFHHAGS